MRLPPSGLQTQSTLVQATNHRTWLILADPRLVICLIACGMVSRAHADEITITAGYLDTVGFRGQISLSGTFGFAFSSNVDGVGGVLSLWSVCSVGCAPGDTVSLRAAWSGMDISGTATLNGVVYPQVGDALSPNFLNVEFSGTVLMPPIATDATVITAPFAFAGIFGHAPFFDGPQTRDTLFGRGTTTMTLQPRQGRPGTWYVQSARYDFTPNPVPEPAAFVLVASGLVGLLWRRRRLRASGHERV